MTHDLFDDLKAGKITMEKVLKDLRRLAESTANDDMDFIDPDVFYGYQQSGDNAPLAYLLNSAVSNLTARTRQ